MPDADPADRLQVVQQKAWALIRLEQAETPRMSSKVERYA